MHHRVLSALRLKVYGGSSSSGSDTFGNDHRNTTDKKCSQGRGVFLLVHQASVGNVPFDRIAFK